jgi:two-component system phosphate regulon response regulator PhoB
MANETILIVEDEADIRELIRYNMEREGYRVAECAPPNRDGYIRRKPCPT